MTAIAPVITVSPRDYDAVLFDLDGVLTNTASVHAAAWKHLFDEFLDRRASDTGEAFVPFDLDADYRRYVDGKPRYDGVASFLEARGIELPWGAPEDPPGTHTVQALSNMKDHYFTQHLEQHGVEVYEASIGLVRALRAQEAKTAVVSSSKNGAAVLEAAGISRLFDTRVDGTDVPWLGFGGKPAPDAFLEAARRLAEGRGAASVTASQRCSERVRLVVGITQWLVTIFRALGIASAGIARARLDTRLGRCTFILTYEQNVHMIASVSPWRLLMRGLSEKQARVLALIQAWIQRTGRAPSYREIAARLGVTVNAAYEHVQALERKGIVTRTRRHRGLQLNPEHAPPAGVPIVGRVAAGTPILASENLEGYLDIDGWLGDRSQLFALRVRGDSMVDRQIHDGDYVIVRAQSWVEHGEIGVVVIDEEATVKTVWHRRHGLWLKPENQGKGYPVIRPQPDQRVHIAGKVIAVFRPLSA